MTTPSRVKIEAWKTAADILKDEVSWRKNWPHLSEVMEHIEAVIIPSLLQRARIIKRNARHK